MFAELDGLMRIRGFYLEVLQVLHLIQPNPGFGSKASHIRVRTWLYLPEPHRCHTDPIPCSSFGTLAIKNKTGRVFYLCKVY